MDFLEQELYSQIDNHGDSSHCLLIEDTSQVGFSLERLIKGLGKVDNGQIKGFYIHPVLVIDAVNYACYGIASWVNLSSSADAIICPSFTSATSVSMKSCINTECIHAGQF